MFMRNKGAKGTNLADDFLDIGAVKRIKEDKKENYFSASDINKLYKRA